MDLENKTTLKRAHEFISRPAKAYRTNDEIIEIAKLLFKLRRHSENTTVEKQVCRKFHRCLRISPSTLFIPRIAHQFAFRNIEVELLLVLWLSYLGLCRRCSDFEDMQGLIRAPAKNGLAVARALSQYGRLAQSGFVHVGDDRMHIELTRRFFTQWEKNDSKIKIPVLKLKNYQALLNTIPLLVNKTSERACSNSLSEHDLFGKSAKDLNEEIAGQVQELLEQLQAHPHWPLYCLCQSKLTYNEQVIILILINKELSDSQKESYTGQFICQSVGRDREEVRNSFELLKAHSSLRHNDFIQIIGQLGDKALNDTTEELEKAEFELTPGYLEKIQVKRKAAKTAIGIREPEVTLNQLVLTDKVKSALDMCIAQNHNRTTMFVTWGLGKTFSYGISTTMLFYGLPGTGKTAAAEALAHKLGKPILVVKYSSLQSCYVGETEKNIAKIFKKASVADAVLFWDEADAMFYSRESAFYSWEVRDVNVLLQEIERFNGICILATNRKPALDIALERRIAIKVEFDAPDAAMRKELWRKLIPAQMPVAEDVSLEKLSTYEFSGGQIKNVILNAARIALMRSDSNGVTVADFDSAIQMEINGSDSLRNKAF